MNRREFLASISVSALVAAGADAIASPPDRPALGNPTVGGPATPEQPNILIIISDQHRAGISKRAGYAVDTTPTLDRLAAQGVDFQRSYCTSPACVPSRVSMLTGRWPDAHRVRMNLDGKEAVYQKDLYQVAREQGYITGLTGKNHTYLTPDRVDFWREYGHGFGYVSPDAPASHKAFETWLTETNFNVSDRPTPFPNEVQHPYRIVSDAIEFLTKVGRRRFCLQVSFPEPHDPEQVSEPYWNMFPPENVPARLVGPEALKRMGFRENWLHGLALSAFPDTDKAWRRYVSNYLGALRMIDDQMKRLLDHMDRSGRLANTIIVVLSDHGDYLMQYGLPRKGVGLPDCLARIPMVWAGPGIRRDANLNSNAHVSMADVMPTLCAFMKAEIPMGVQGRSLKPLLCGNPFPSDEFRSIYATAGVGGLYYGEEDRVPYSAARRGTSNWDELNKVTQSGNQKMVRMGDWKLIYDMMGYGQLFHLPTDPAELDNRFEDPAAAAPRNALLAELLMWTIRNEDSLPTGPQNNKYQTKWPAQHNWYAPHREAKVGTAFRP
jgi:arylsulfatase A-like enzyme